VRSLHLCPLFPELVHLANQSINVSFELSPAFSVKTRPTARNLKRSLMTALGREQALSKVSA